MYKREIFMDTETVPVEQEVVEQAPQEAPQEEVQEEIHEEIQEQVQQEEERVPLSAMLKERRRRQDLEQELRWEKEQKAKAAVEPDDSLYETVTRQDLGNTQSQIIQAVEERSWMRQNPEKAREVDSNLEEFLKKRPNLAAAIQAAPNRYEEAWELMDKLSPKQKAELRAPAVKKVTPGSPTSIPKAAGLNDAVDLMHMTDAEYNEWRAAKRRR